MIETINADIKKLDGGCESQRVFSWKKKKKASWADKIKKSSHQALVRVNMLMIGVIEGEGKTGKDTWENTDDDWEFSKLM